MPFLRKIRTVYVAFRVKVGPHGIRVSCRNLSHGKKVSQWNLHPKGSFHGQHMSKGHPSSMVYLDSSDTIEPRGREVIHILFRCFLLFTLTIVRYLVNDGVVVDTLSLGPVNLHTTE